MALGEAPKLPSTARPRTCTPAHLRAQRIGSDTSDLEARSWKSLRKKEIQGLKLFSRDSKQ